MLLPLQLYPPNRLFLIKIQAIIEPTPLTKFILTTMAKAKVSATMGVVKHVLYVSVIRGQLDGEFQARPSILDPGSRQ